MDFAKGRRGSRIMVMLICLALMAVRGAMAAEQLDWNTFSQGIFDSSHRIGTDVQLVTGPIVYHDRDDGDFTEGYRPESAHEIPGARIRREVYDLPEVWGAPGVFAWTLGRLEEAGFETVFQCEESVCGDVAGWQLYLSDLVAGTPNGQHYVLARTSAEPGWSTWVTAYVNDIDSRPRLILDHVVPSRSDWAEKRVVSEATLRFRSGGSQVDASEIASLRRTLKKTDSPQGAKLLILGNADSHGPLFMNLWLSGLRARHVRDHLISDQALSRRNPIIKPLGSLVPKGNNASSEGRRNNRRVDVLMVD